MTIITYDPEGRDVVCYVRTEAEMLRFLLGRWVIVRPYYFREVMSH